MCCDLGITFKFCRKLTLKKISVIIISINCIMKKALTTLRLAYYGCPNRPFFHIVATRRKIARNRGYFEQIGTYDPMPNDRNEKLVSLNMDRVKFWLSQGCSTSKPVARLLGLAGIFPADEKTLTKANLNREKKIDAECEISNG